MAELLEVKNLSVTYRSPRGDVQAVRDVSCSLRPGEVLAVVGESGCGKRALCRAVMRLLPDSAAVSGEILVNGVDIAPYRERELQKLRGRLFSMVFQDPLTALNPSMTIGAQIAEAVRVHDRKAPREAVSARVEELMALVGIDQAAERMHAYPHQFSGGMRQRAVLAIALAGNPQILFADEPTTALDVTVQAQILDLLRDVQQKLGTATVLVSHDLGVVARAADRVAVMYAGRIVEIGTAEEVYYDPRHPYTWALLSSMPQMGVKGEDLFSIPGTPPNLFAEIHGDAFAPRNPQALKIDFVKRPPYFAVPPPHEARPWVLDPRAPRIEPPAAVKKLQKEGL